MSALRKPIPFPSTTSSDAASPADLELVTTPGSMRVLAWTLMALLAVTVLTLIFVPWQQSVWGSGRVTSLIPPERQQSIDAPVDGRIVRWLAIEGGRIKKGDPLVEIADIDPNLPLRLRAEREAMLDRVRAVREREVQLSGRVQELEQSLRNELAAADFRIQQAGDRVRGAEQTIEAGQVRELVTRQNRERHRALFPKGLVSQRQVELAQAEAETAIADLKRGGAALDESRSFRSTAEAERGRALNTGTALVRDGQASRQSALGEIASAQQALQLIEGRLNRQTAQTVLAPADGTIFRLVAQPGSAVIKAGEEIATFVPENSSPVVEVWVSGNDMPLLSKDRPVRLQFEGWPAVQFVGWPSVAVGTFGGRVLFMDSTDDGKGRFRVLVGPDPNDKPWPTTRYLRQGVRAKGWILLNTVPLGFEFWRQFNGFPPTIDQKAADIDDAVKRKAK